ncbi:unnamed protein product [Thlaspi arvense]|uniref:Uncharacterized protein n=1 Tax=Thlaspi arvense TaxID=13288 RepID=A0AAU9SA10_THLAR|nr:unnamed protein product [Thlaspi arvense]
MRKKMIQRIIGAVTEPEIQRDGASSPGKMGGVYTDLHQVHRPLSEPSLYRSDSDIIPDSIHDLWRSLCLALCNHAEARARLYDFSEVTKRPTDPGKVISQRERELKHPSSYRKDIPRKWFLEFNGIVPIAL